MSPRLTANNRLEEFTMYCHLALNRVINRDDYNMVTDVMRKTGLGVDILIPLLAELRDQLSEIAIHT